MDDKDPPEFKHLLLFGQVIPGNDEMLLGRLLECASARNRNEITPTKAIESIPASEIVQIAIGPNHVAFLLKDFRVARVFFDIIKVTVADVNPSDKTSKSNISTGSTSTSVNVDINATTSAVATSENQGQTTTTTSAAIAPAAGISNSTASSSYAAAASAAANRTAKIRRVMMAARRPGGFSGRTGVIIDRARPLIPPSAVPEELIAQAQVVLQGKSREVIVKELQRTNLNVNEAVNNLLSRDDDEGDEFDDSDAYLHEELLSLLDAGLRSDSGPGAAIIDHENIYTSADGYEYLISRDIARRRTEQESRTKDRNKEVIEKTDVTKEQIVFSDTLQYWGGEISAEWPFPKDVKKFIKICAMNSDLIVLADDGKIYSWSWVKTSQPNNHPHPVNALFYSDERSSCYENERMIDIESCLLRCCVLTTHMRTGSFVDSICGKKLADFFFEPLIDIPDGESVSKLLVSPLTTAIYSTSNALYWRGIYPFNERRKIWEKAKSRSRKHVTFDTGEIVEGTEVRTKSSPIYAAGSVAVNFTNGEPVVGILMESAWTLNETCRFRIQTPEQYDNSTDEKPSPSERKVSFNLSVRKRAAPSDEQPSATESNGISSSLIKESAWQIKDVVFTKEEIVSDTGIVKIVDGSYCGIIFKSTLENLQREGVSDFSNVDVSRLGIRLMRKDDLIVVSSKNLASRSPENFQKQFQRISIRSTTNRILSVAIDASGFRILTEKRNRIHLLRINCLGKILSDHLLPIDRNAICRQGDGVTASLSLENYGDESMLLLRDCSGSVHLLLRNAVGGYKEFNYVGMGRVACFGLGTRFIKPDEINTSTFSILPPPSTNTLKPSLSPSSEGSRLALISFLLAPFMDASLPKISSSPCDLMQSILLCDLSLVKSILSQLENAPEEAKRKQIVDERIEGNRTIFHVAVMNSFAKTNKYQADFDALEQQKSSKSKQALDTTEAESTRLRYDRKWQKMVGAPTSKSKPSSKDKDDEKKEPSTSNTFLPINPRERQANSIEIISELIKNAAVIPFFQQLMRERDIDGFTPLQCAIQCRAYSAALLIWNKMVESSTETSSSNESKSGLTDIALPMGTRVDDNILFVLCYNDTCSYTWTGDEHVNQDIFECRTCGLVGTLCCCTECAYTCHRNHDCTLKRTSPTAYCDCWEKCPCKALVTGNTGQREVLLNELLQRTTLINRLNSKGEHLLLFLARTVGRQLIEQESFVRRTKHRPPLPPSTTNSAAQSESDLKGITPEHDLEPPRFSRKALEIVLSDWGSVQSLLNVGMKNRSDDIPLVEELFHLTAQDGSTHLDKFVFALLARCQEEHLDILLNLLVFQANIIGKNRSPNIDNLILRFVRSVIRMMFLITVLSPAATGFMISAITSSVSSMIQAQIQQKEGKPAQMLALSSASSVTSSTQTAGSKERDTISGYRAVAISGVLSLVRASLPISLLTTSSMNDSVKDAKKIALHSFMMKIRRIFQVLVSYTIVELLNACDALISPIRLGILKPSIITSSFGTNGNANILDLIEKHLNGEKDLTTLIQCDTKNLLISKDSSKAKKNVPEKQQVEENEEWSSVSDDDDEEFSGNESSDDNMDVLPEREANISFGVQDDHQTARNNELDLENLDDEEEADDEEHEDEEDDGWALGDDDDDEGGDGDGESGTSENPSEMDGIINAAEIDGVDSNDTIPGNQEILGNRSNSENFDVQSRDQQISIADQESSEINNIRQGYIVPPLSWAINRVRLSDESSSLRINTADAAANTPPMTDSTRPAAESTETTATNTIPTSNQRERVSVNPEARTRLKEKQVAIPSEGHALSTGNTASQFAISFSCLLKMVDELILQFSYINRQQLCLEDAGAKRISQFLNLDPGSLRHYLNIWNYRLTPIWEWFALVMDRTEAQLKFGNAIASSPIGPLIEANTTNNVEGTHSSGKYVSKRAVTRQYRKKADLSRKNVSHVGGVDNDTDVNRSRSDFFTYCLSLLRSASSENGDDLPVIEYTSLKAMTFIAEAYLFHISLFDQLNGAFLNIDDGDQYHIPVGVVPTPGLEAQDKEIGTMELQPKFYRRSKSLCYPSISASDKHHAFKYAANECLPLSTHPHLLKSNSEKHSLFGLPTPLRTRTDHLDVSRRHGVFYPTHQSLSRPPTQYNELVTGGLVYAEKVALQPPIIFDMNDEQKRPNVIMHSSQIKDQIASASRMDVDNILSRSTTVSSQYIQNSLGRWSNTFAFLGMVYHEVLALIHDNNPTLSVLLNETAGFNVRNVHFRRLMEKFRASQTRDLTFSQMSREKHTFLAQTLRQLDQQYNRRVTGSTSSASTASSAQDQQPLASNKVKVTFRDEPGEGTGVARSFYSAIADAFLTCKHVALTSSVATDKEAKGGDKDVQKTSGKDPESGAFFYRTSKSGYYTPIPGSNSQQRLNAFRNVGRIIGICLQQMEIMPFNICRHVFKFILNKPICWFDLAFYDPSIFDSLRSIVYNEETDGTQNSEFYEQLQLTFAVDIPAEEGGGVAELKPGGENIPVTRSNVLEYIMLFVENRLLGNHIKCLEAIRKGVFDVVPPETIAHLSPEDFRLILCGTQEISVALLKSFTKFSDESSAPTEVLARYKQQFWSVVNKFTNAEKQDLIFFWTGSPTLPPTEDGWQPLPTIMIRPADDHHLPTANTCISRLYVPLYSSRKILRAKLLIAIKARNFGFV